MKIASALSIVVLFFCSPAFASTEITKEAVDTVWIVTASALVFFMQAGFALLESGLSRSKNCINVVMKNFTDVCVGSLVFWALGFGLMFGVNQTGWFGQSAFLPSTESPWTYSFILFQTMFAATAATIASGAMAERTRFGAYLWCSAVITGFIYPVFGSWAWGSFYDGSGWLAEMNFIDFAGSTVVHSVGGWSALAAIIILGPRMGRFSKDGRVREIPGHNLNYLALGGFILWLGWFGFNGGSSVAADASIGLINLNTHLSGAAGAVGACFIARLAGQSILVSTVVNGCLAGLVGITAGCASMEPHFAIITGISSGMVAFLGDKLLTRLTIDDVVGAVSVHAIAGAWGTICAGIFYQGDLFNLQIILVQCVGVGACFIWTFGTALIIFKAIDLLYGLRADPQHEQRGLDYTEHQEVSYPEFMQHSFYTKSNLEGVEK